MRLLWIEHCHIIKVVIINQAFLTETYQCLQISISEVGFSLALSQLLIVSDYS